ncbi:MAG: F0F1 ATP synthase subunit B [Candidatus Pacebacteria bacterium]|nr:F0F1 ATP synthase subunit B [Candidatus Paceibacterota bacterium]
MSSLEIDWKILIGQIVNFTILFFVLKFFLYKPFLNLLKTRREKIEDGVNKSLEAEEKLSQLKEMKSKMEKDNEEEKKAILLKAQEEAKKRGEEMSKKLEEEKVVLLAKAQKEAEELKEKEKEKTRKETIDNAFSLAEKLLKENIDDKKGKEITEDFLSKIKA